MIILDNEIEIWEQCKGFVKQNILLIRPICTIFQERARERNIEVLQMEIRPTTEKTLGVYDAVMIEMTIYGTSDLRFELFDDVCKSVADFSEKLSEQNREIVNTYIYLWINNNKKRE